MSAEQKSGPARLVKSATTIGIVVSLLIAAFFVRLIVDKERYLKDALMLFRETTIATGNISDTTVKIATADLTLRRGARKLMSERSKLAGIKQELRGKSPPFGSKAFHYHFIRALDIYIKASDSLAEGYKRNDKSTVGDAIKMWANGKTELDRAFGGLR